MSQELLASALLAKPELLAACSDLELNHFADFRPRLIYSTIRNLEAIGLDINVDTVVAHLELEGKGDAFSDGRPDGTRLYLERLRDSAKHADDMTVVKLVATVMQQANDREDVVRGADNGPATVTKPMARVVTMSTVKREHVDWLWDGWIARGMLNLIDGDPGVGKSTVTLDLTARVTRGLAMPNEAVAKCQPSDVILIGNEDHLGATVMPRLAAADADLTRVHAIVAVPTLGDKDAPPTLADVAQVEQVIRDRKVALVIIDPLMAHLPSGTDAYRDSEMRALLGPWAMMAQRTGVAVVLVRHLRKMGGSALYRGGGTVGIVGAVRSAMLVGRDPEDPDSCVLAHSKGNLAPAPKSLRYRVVDCDGIGRIEWLGVADGVTADHLAELPDKQARGTDPVDAAVDALRRALASGARPTTDVHAEVKAMTGASPRTIERARSKLGVVATRDGNNTAKGGLAWLLSLPCGGVEIGQDRLCDRGGGVVVSNSPISMEYNNSLHTATYSKKGGGLEGGGVLEDHNAATGSAQAVWSSAVWSGARRAGLHGDDND